MFRLINKLIIIFVISFICINILSFYIISNQLLSHYFKLQSIGKEVYEAIESSKEYYPSKDTVILGDSVAKELITTGLKDEINVVDLTCNQAISLAGHYILLVNTLSRNPQVRKVYLLYHVDSFKNDLDQIWTYNYFIKPLYIDNEQLVKQPTRNIIQSHFYWILFKFPIAKVLPVFGQIDYSCKNAAKKNYSYLSPTSIEYLGEMKNICQHHNVTLKIIPVPVSENKVRNYDYIRMQIKENSFSDIFNGYLNKLIVLNDEFYRDHIHFKPDYIRFVSHFSMNYTGLLEEITTYPLPPGRQ
jgi:hypothetical protein